MGYVMKIQLGPNGANGKSLVGLDAKDRVGAEDEAAGIGKSLPSMMDWWVEGKEDEEA